MASEFQKRKVAAVFGAMDVDKDGYLEQDDFEALAARWTGLEGVDGRQLRLRGDADHHDELVEGAA